MNSYKNKRALLLGNGINRLDENQSYSWWGLLNSLKEKYGIDVDLTNDFKPFPLAFEEMRHRKSGGNTFNDKLKNLKQTIHKDIKHQLKGKDGFNNYHRRFVQHGYDDILTTNYDYSLELSSGLDFAHKKQDWAINRQERNYSLRRGYRLPKLTNVWHIHGELESARNIKPPNDEYLEESILIGYDQYNDYFGKIQDNFNGVHKNIRNRKYGLKSRILNDKAGKHWTDLFFTHHIDIIGFGLDFSENHLWWLINERAAYFRNNSRGELKVNNKITYYYPEMEESISPTDPEFFNKARARLNANEKAKAIAELLVAFHVESKPIPCSSYEEFYDTLLTNHL